MSELIEINIRHMIHAASGPVEMDIHLTIQKGSVFALTGPSGSGKTTLLKLIAGLLKPDFGTITFGGDLWLDTRVKEQKAVQHRRIGFVFQDYALFPNFTVRENLLFAKPKDMDERVVDELLERAELTSLQERRPAQLSGGQQQRVAIIRAIVSKPELLILDEPMSALDAGFRETVQEILFDFHQRYRYTIILVTHQIADIFQIADKVAILEAGKMVRQGAPPEVFLPDGGSGDEQMLYAEVLSVREESSYLKVSVLFQNKILTVNVNRDPAPDFRAGDQIGIPVSVLLSDYSVFRRDDIRVSGEKNR